MCSDTFRRGGFAVDAAIATQICTGIVHCHSMGIGGGFFMTVYTKETKTTEVLNARETAPHYAHEDMMNGDSNLSQKGTEENNIWY